MRLHHVTLIVSSLDASLRFYEKLGLRPIVLAEPRYARLRDPDGHQVRLYDAGVNRLNPPWRIDR